MTREEATRILDEVIPPPEHQTVDLDHMPIAQAWLRIKEELTAEPNYEQIEEYCRKHCLVVVDGALFSEMKSRWSSEPVKHGRWERPYVGMAYKRCSVCGFTHSRIPTKALYCCNCGAIMDEVKE